MNYQKNKKIQKYFKVLNKKTGTNNNINLQINTNIFKKNIS